LETLEDVQRAMRQLLVECPGAQVAICGDFNCDLPAFYPLSGGIDDSCAERGHAILGLMNEIRLYALGL
jgi:hypothetical protein